MFDSLPMLQAENLKCRLCELGACGRIKSGAGSNGAKLFLLFDGMRPGSGFLQARPLLLIKKILNEARVDPSILYWTHAIKCARFEKQANGWEKPLPHTKNHLNTCNVWLRDELRLLNPTVVLAFGQAAVVAALPSAKSKLKELIGQEIQDDESGRTVIPLYSPTTLLNMADWHTERTIFIVKRALEIVNG